MGSLLRKPSPLLVFKHFTAKDAKIAETRHQRWDSLLCGLGDLGGERFCLARRRLL